MKRTIFIVLILFILAGLGTGFYMFTKKVPGLEDIKADYTLTADEVFNSFDSNEDEASKKYIGKVIKVTGKVISKKEADNQYTITLEAENAIAGGINCSFRENPGIIEKETMITVKGRCQGFLMNVVLNNCILERE